MTGPWRWLAVTMCLVAAFGGSGCSTGPSIDTEFPPGDPVLAEDSDPAASDEITASTSEEADSTDYTLLAVIALCLIAAGILLIRVERWQERRYSSPMESE